MPVQDASQRAELLRKLAEGLDQRRPLPGGAAREGLDAHLVSVLTRLRAAARRPVRTVIPAAPPRDVAVPLALALYSQPHVARTFIDPDEAGTHPGDAPVIFPPEQVRIALGLQAWELEELRDDVDRRASEHLRQRRCARWLCTHWGDHDPHELFRRLFPGAPPVPDVRIARVGGQLYALLEAGGAPPPTSVLLPWLAEPGDAALPLGAFAGRYADGSLRARLGRAVGLDEADVIDLLDAMVTLVPRRQHHATVARDRWRSTGAATLTGLASSYARGRDVDGPLPALSVGLEGWLEAAEGRIRLGDAETAFDQVALRRVAEAMRLVVAALLSRAWSGSPVAPDVEDLHVFDVSSHLRAALDPIVAWPASPHTASAVGRFLAMPAHQVSGVLERIGQRWRERAARWLRPPTPEDPWPVAARLTDLLVRLSAHIEALTDEPTLEQPHRDAVLLYVGHRVADAPDAELLPADPDLPGLPESLTDVWWGAWHRLFAGAGGPADETWGGIPL